MRGKAQCTLGLASVVLALAALLQRLTTHHVRLAEPDTPAALRQALVIRPNDGTVRAQLALALLEPVEEVAPNTDESSLYGDGFTLYHPNLVESRRMMEESLRLGPGVTEAHLAHQAVLMAEGNGEDALQAGRRAVELSPHSGHAYAALARSHLLAGCAQGCAVRNSLRREKQEEKVAGRKSPLEAREAEAEASQKKHEQREKGEKPELDRGGLKAGAMWRVMEAGRIFGQGAEADPKNKEIKRLAKRSRHLLTLDAHKVLNTEEIIKYGECHRFFGQELVSMGVAELCDKKRFKYE